MARPKKSGLDYFPFDVDFWSDKKIRVLKNKFGGDAVNLYNYLLCAIYADKGYYLQCDEEFIELAATDLAMSENETRQILNYLVTRSLFFDDKLYHSVKVLTAKSVQRRYQSAKCAGSKSAASIAAEVDGNYWLLSPEETNSHIQVTHFLNKEGKNTDKEQNNADKEQKNATKESKAKKSREKEIKFKRVNGVEIPVSVPEALEYEFSEFIKMRNKRKSTSITPYAMVRKVEKLNALAPGNLQLQKATILKAIDKGWQDFYPLTEDDMREYGLMRGGGASGSKNFGTTI